MRRPREAEVEDDWPARDGVLATRRSEKVAWLTLFACVVVASALPFERLSPRAALTSDMGVCPEVGDRRGSGEHGRRRWPRLVAVGCEAEMREERADGWSDLSMRSMGKMATSPFSKPGSKTTDNIRIKTWV